jgi:translation elongation factor EF-1alpha
MDFGDEARFRQIVDESTLFLGTYGYKDVVFIPVIAQRNQNVTVRGEDFLPWYTGPTILDALTTIKPTPKTVEKPLRIVVLGTELQTQGDLKGELVVGRIVGGILSQNDKLVVNPGDIKFTVGKLYIGNEKVPKA